MNSQLDGRGRPIVFDATPSGSVRTEDENGYLHVAVSNITKEQVAPYLGKEIPNGRELGFEDDTIYRGYRPASELSKRVTVESLNGVPILLRHHPDSADDPAPNRVGATGTDARWAAPYLTNSLHIQDSRAIDRIKDGTMREISMGYSYTPIRRKGEFRGQPYDFVMTDIICNHVALVEKGRAGGDVIVEDHALAAGQGNSSKQEGNAMDENKEAIIAELLQQLEDAGIDTEKARAKLEALADGAAADGGPEADPEGGAADEEGIAYNAGFVNGSKGRDKDDAEDDEEVEEEVVIDPDTDPDPAEDGEGEIPDPAAKDGDDPEGDLGLDDDERRQLSELGCDVDDPKVIAAFRKGMAEGTAYGERLEKSEPRRLAREHEAKGERKALGEDSVERIATAVTRAVTSRLERKFAAMDECAPVLGRVRATAFDSADAVYRAALKKSGVSVAGMKAGEARTAFRAYRAATAARKRGMASDAAPREDALGKLISNMKIGG